MTFAIRPELVRCFSSAPRWVLLTVRLTTGAAFGAIYRGAVRANHSEEQVGSRTREGSAIVTRFRIDFDEAVDVLPIGGIAQHAGALQLACAFPSHRHRGARQ